MMKANRPVQILRPQTFACTTDSHTLDSFWYRIAYPPHLLSLHFGLMAVVAAFIVAALCATGVGMYADCDRLVVTVRWQHGCRRPRGRPPRSAS